MTDLLIVIFAILVVALSFPFLWNAFTFFGLLKSELINDVSDSLTNFISYYKNAWKDCVEDVRRFIHNGKV